MIYIYIEEKLKEKYKSKIDYSIEFIFSFLGYNYNICDNIKKIKKTDSLIIYSENISYDYCKDMVNNEIISKLIYIEAYSEVWENNFFSRADTDENLFKVSDFLVFSLGKPKMQEYSNSILHFGFDLFSNAYYHMKVNENNLKALNNFSNLKGNYVNRMLLYFENLLIYPSSNTYNIKKINLPFTKKKALLALCFSVDSLIKWEINKDFFKNFFSNNIFYNFISVFKFLFSNKEEYWNFSKLQEIKNTCFLAFSKVNYNLQDEKINLELNKIRNMGNEISYWLKNKELINKNLNLEKNFGLKINEIQDIDLNFKYLYKEQVADYGIAYPYNSYFFDKKGEKKIIFSAYRLPHDLQNLDLIDSLINRSKEENGLLILDIYFSYLSDNKNLRKFIDKLKDEDFSLYSLKELNNWIKAKDSIFFEEQENEFTITFLEEIKDFAFKIIGNYKVKDIFNVDYYLEDRTIVFPKVNYLTQAKVVLEKLLASS